MLKKLNPTSPGQRHTILLQQKQLSKVKKVKKNSKGFKNSAGRNNLGKITCTGRGSGHKKIYKKIDFLRFFKTATVIAIEYDPNRSANIAKLYSEGSICYIIAPVSIKLGDQVYSGKNSGFRQPGNHVRLKNIPIGTLVHNIELKLGCGGQLARSAGVSGKILSKTYGFVSVLLSSGKTLVLSEKLSATIGIVSNYMHQFQILGKAGRNR